MTDIFIDGILVSKIQIGTNKKNVDFYDKNKKLTHSYVQGEIEYYEFELENGKTFRVHRKIGIEEWRV